MPILVTGATGFIGRAVTKALLDDGQEVHGLVRDPNKATELADAGVTLHRADMLDTTSYQPLVSSMSAVVHAAQYAVSGRFTAKNAKLIRDGDHAMTTALADACQESGVRLVYTSGCFNYGDRGAEWIDESTPFAPSPLGAGHAAEVVELRRRHRTAGLDAVVIAPGFVYGPGGLFKSAFYDQAVAKRLKVIGKGDNYWSPIHVDDLARAYAAAVRQAPAGAEYCVVDDEPLTLRALVDQVTDQMGQGRVGTIPPFFMNLLLGKALVDSLLTSFRMTNGRAKAELGWAPRYPRFADGLAPSLAALGGGSAGASETPASSGR